MQLAQHSSIVSLACAVAGPAAIGAAIGMPSGASKMVSQALYLPAIVVGTSLFMLPALYIASSLVGIAPSASSVLKSWIGAQRDAGVLLLGLSPAALFLLATAQSSAVVWLLASSSLLFGAFLSFKSLHNNLFSAIPKAKSLPVFAVWASVALGLGVHLVAHSLAA